MKNHLQKIIFVLALSAIQINIQAIQLPFKKVDNASDSLLKILSSEKNATNRVSLYRNLADIYYSEKEEAEYLESMYNTALEQDNKAIAIQSLYDLSLHYLDKDSVRKAEHYRNLLSKYRSAEEFERLDTYLSMRLFNQSLLRNKGDVAIRQKLDSYTKDADPNNKSIYKQIEHAYVVALALNDTKDESATSYAQDAVELTNKLKSNEGIDYIVLTKRLLARIYAIKHEASKSIQLVEEVIAAKEKYVRECCQNRPFYPMTSFYVRNYTTIMLNIRKMPQTEAKQYLDIIMGLTSGSKNPADKYNCFLSINNYYLSKNIPKEKPLPENLKAALWSNDSLIKYAKVIAPYNLPGLYNMSALIHNALGEHEQAYKKLQISHHFKDSLDNKTFKDKLNILQVEYDVNKLNYENARLEVSNKRITIIALITVILLAIGLCIYLYTNLKKERLMMARLVELNKKAEESEKMKRAFINSICHEIRTPLNAIAGFSELITDPTFEIDDSTRLEFSNLIRLNTQMLTDLIDVIIEVANLDASDQPLECEKADIAMICHNNISRFSANGKKTIKFETDIVPESIMLSTHARYFGLVIENLLSNANKFTETGSITIACRTVDSMVMVTITDTGCGIAEDKHEYVFERFTKLDTYAQGNGLGLYLCRLIVTRLCGKIYIDPTYKNGTRMVIELPIR